LGGNLISKQSNTNDRTETHQSLSSQSSAAESVAAEDSGLLQFVHYGHWFWNHIWFLSAWTYGYDTRASLDCPCTVIHCLLLANHSISSKTFFDENLHWICGRMGRFFGTMIRK
jgi:hypothetical protein